MTPSFPDLGNLRVKYGDVLGYVELPARWKGGYKKKPAILLELEDQKLVLHSGKDTSQIIALNSILDEKNKEKLISSPIVYVGDTFFYSEYVEGVKPPTDPNTLLDIARLQAKFHRYPESTVDLQVWEDRYNEAVHYLEKEGVLTGEVLPDLTFTRRGLLHGDYHHNNLVLTENGLVAIDLEHLVIGPIAVDLARPLVRMCGDTNERNNYLKAYFNQDKGIGKIELQNGVIAYYVIQIYKRVQNGFMPEARKSLAELENLLCSIKKS